MNLNRTHIFESRMIPGQPWGPDGVTHKFKTEIRKAGLPESYSLHSLRHTYATHLQEKGVPRDIVQKLLGHSSPVTTGIYDHSEALHFREYADKADFG
ncbi:MAG: site-specific integrase [Candidatus Latescibacteria bacterium]|nr:site-specific integrase [Candidatus Latescibacterota bacterium]